MGLSVHVEGDGIGPFYETYGRLPSCVLSLHGRRGRRGRRHVPFKDTAGAPIGGYPCAFNGIPVQLKVAIEVVQVALIGIREFESKLLHPCKGSTLSLRRR